MRQAPANAVQPGQLTRVTVASQRIPVQARIVAGAGERWVTGTADAWTRGAVCVWWTDRTDSLRRVDWLPVGDVRRY